MDQVTEIWADTGKVIQRDPTLDEVAAWDAARELQVQAQAAAEAEIAEREVARTALLERLGITEYEAALLMGGL